MRDWDNLNNNEQHFVKHVLAFFAVSDGIVQKNMYGKFAVEVQVSEARAFYGFWVAMENIHSETYSLLIRHYIRDPREMASVIDTIRTMSPVRDRAQWVVKWMNKDTSFTERIVALAAVEGVLLSGSYCAIYWMKKRGLLPGLTYSNTHISRDKGLHTEFACLLYRTLKNPLPEDVLHEIIRGAVDVERNFICEALSCDLIGMNSKMLQQYIEFVADRLLLALGHTGIYGASNPFDWISANFSEPRVGEDHRARVMALGEGHEGSRGFALDADF